LVPGTSLYRPAARSPCSFAVSSATPSTIAASSTCPTPDERASSTAETIPNAASRPPPA
jgi:hypothetical protein